MGGWLLVRHRCPSQPLNSRRPLAAVTTGNGSDDAYFSFPHALRKQRFPGLRRIASFSCRRSCTLNTAASVRMKCPVVAGGMITAHPRWSRVRRKWVQPEASQNPPDAEGEAADTFDRPQAVEGRLTRKELIS